MHNIINENIKETHQVAFKKESKRLIYDRNNNKITDCIYFKTSNIKKNNVFDIVKNNQNKINTKENINNLKKQLREKKLENELEKINRIENNIDKNIINMGYIIPLKKQLREKNFNHEIEKNKENMKFLMTLEALYQIENINLNKQLKKIIRGLTQGFSINLELKGIGYTAKIIDLEKQNKEKKEKYSLSQLDSNINQINQNLYNRLNLEQTKQSKKSYSNWSKIKKLKYKSIKINDLKKEKNLILRLGTSHNIIYPLYKYEIIAKILAPQNNFITLALFGISLTILKKVAAEIYVIRKPEPYKGKGIRYDGEKFFAKEKKKKN
jgi:ribosomal protein L6P/L9E